MAVVPHDDPEVTILWGFGTPYDTGGTSMLSGRAGGVVYKALRILAVNPARPGLGALRALHEDAGDSHAPHRSVTREGDQKRCCASSALKRELFAANLAPGVYVALSYDAEAR